MNKINYEPTDKVVHTLKEGDLILIERISGLGIRIKNIYMISNIDVHNSGNGMSFSLVCLDTGKLFGERFCGITFNFVDFNKMTLEEFILFKSERIYEKLNSFLNIKWEYIGPCEITIKSREIK